MTRCGRVKRRPQPRDGFRAAQRAFCAARWKEKADGRHACGACRNTFSRARHCHAADRDNAQGIGAVRAKCLNGLMERVESNTGLVSGLIHRAEEQVIRRRVDAGLLNGVDGSPD